jgi:chorismate synthase
MSHNSFGKLLKVTTWGESHGKAIGCVVDGVPPLLELSEDDIQPFLEKRKPGQSKFTTQRKEDDKVEILSGVFEGKTTGTPISLMIWNKDQRSKDYGEIANQYRPGHADYTYDKKYGIRDYKGGGRSSARETAMRVAAGAIARKIIAKHDIKVRAALTQMGEIEINRSNWDWNEVEQNPFFSPDKNSVTNFENYLNKIRKDGSSVGAIIEVVAENVPVGLGEPIYGKLDSDLASAMMSINAVKGVEIGLGMQAGKTRGEENSDEIRIDKETNKPKFLSNNAGGILGGISSGQDIVVKFSVKPTSSMLKPMRSIDKNGNEIDVITKGRHDPCVGIRAVPVAEAMMALTLADHILRNKAQCG